MSSEDDLPIISKKKKQSVTAIDEKETSSERQQMNDRKRKSSNKEDKKTDSQDLENLSDEFIKTKVQRTKKSPKEKAESKKIKEERISLSNPKLIGKKIKKRIKLNSGIQDSPPETPSELFVKGDARRYFKPYQKEMCPPNGDSTRGFYESLLEENPNSLIAIKFCVEFGCLIGSKLKSVTEKYEKLKEAGLLPASYSGGKNSEVVELLLKSGE
eukprot:GHVP01034958.1.p1 GENE.GHVP01034958.1~~GHVP01034958.1.p1  ORF type:complete len:214 (-),score=64.94 GHVP01034958.1:108-749(-)